MQVNDPLEAAPLPPEDQEKEYIVALKKDADYDQFWHEMESNTNNLPSIPNRAVDIVNNRPGSVRSCHYALTDQEAANLKNDPRIAVVSVPAPPGLKDHYALQFGNFSRTSSNIQTKVNWGLKRCAAETLLTSPGFGYEYCLDGTGVDIVIQDNGVQTGHPEWLDDYQQSRFIEHDWYVEAGISGTMPSNHYGNVGNHGSHVAGIAAGKVYGWAKNAKIYSIRYDLWNDEAFDLIRMWHLRKPIDPKTGVRRPTIVNQSWGYRWYYDNGGLGSITGINYRGVNRGTTTNASWGNVNSTHNITYSPDDVNQEELTDAGIICVRAAGNYYHKIDIPSGLDWDNYYTYNTTYAGIYPAGDPIYYHRKGSPYSNDTILVANVDATSYDSSTEQLISSSERGPGIDIAAPGTYITSATNNNTDYSWLYYPGSSTYKIARISGTSMAAPQVTGLLALFLQINPHATSQQCKNWLTNVASKSGQLYTTGLDNDYSNSRSLQGGPNKFLYSPYAKNIGYNINGSFQLRSK